jgi:hypothetical protein
MGDDSVISCIYDDATSRVIAEVSWNSGQENDPITNNELGIVSGSVSGGLVNSRLFCRFQRLKVVSSSKRRRSARAISPADFYQLDGTTNYYILMAKGMVTGGEKQYHRSSRLLSDAALNLTAMTNSSSGASEGEDSVLEQQLVKAHAIIMLFAWTVFASFGILMPRYYKTTWPGETWLGKAIWFQIHQHSRGICPDGPVPSARPPRRTSCGRPP